MNIEQNLQRAEGLLTVWNKETTHPEPNRLDVCISAGDLRPAVTALHKGHWGYLSAITGLDLGPEANQLEALYHFCNGAAITTLRIRLPRTNTATLPTIEDIIPPATFFEREIHEMLGFRIKGAKNSDRLFIPDDWPEDVYPLRSDFSIEQAKPVEGRHANELPDEGVVGGNTFVVPIGPQHPALKSQVILSSPWMAKSSPQRACARLRPSRIEKAAESRTGSKTFICSNGSVGFVLIPIP
jgi:NADH:ubiquinone oxidoreductase subunit C